MFNDAAIQEILTSITNDDENSFSIIKCMMQGKTTDEEIAEDTEIRLNIVRRVLYKLYDAGIASYKRSKDPETQWYTYNWKFEEKKVFEILDEKYEKISQELNESLIYEEENMFFVCQLNGHRYNFEEASESNFTCGECGAPLEYQDNSAIISELKELKERMN
ncbi:MAG: transcription factor E [Methanobacterium sp.]|nr:transcription factor E [Methanobacterium sp.]